MNTIFTNIFASADYSDLADNLIEKSGTEMNFRRGNYEHTHFPDGENYYRLLNAEEIRNRPAVYIAGTVNDQALMELYHICSALVMEQCSSLHIVIPYFGYSTMERSTKRGEVVIAKNIARLLSSIPMSAHGNFVYMLDLHSLGTQYYFEGSIRPIHLTAEPLIKQMLADIGEDVVLATADMGRAKWVQKMSGRLGLDSAYIMKQRLSGDKTEVVALNANVAGRKVAIYDDMIRSGNSIINAAQAYHHAGASEIYVITTHGVFIDGALEKMKSSGLIKGVYCTNTHIRAVQEADDKFLTVYDISPVLLSGLEISN